MSLSKKFKIVLLRQNVYLQEAYVEVEKLSTNIIVSIVLTYGIMRWKLFVKQDFASHKKEDVDPSNFDKIVVGAAVQFFSPKLLVL